MGYKNYHQVKAVQESYRKKILAHNPSINNDSGIYFFTRKDESGKQSAYIGQAIKIMNRLLSHCTGYQHIDISVRKYGLYSESNPYGWKINFYNFPKEELDEKEKYFIKRYSDAGFRLYNITGGGQGEGKMDINERKPAKKYKDGLEQGRKNLAKELNDIIEKHLVIELKDEKKNNKVSQKALEKFWSLLEC